MILHFIEASHGGGGNWGKFAIGRFSLVEWQTTSALPELAEAPWKSLLHARGWRPDHLLFLDLQTGEGAILRPGGSARADLQKRKIWICPMAEPFLEWLYGQDLSDLSKLPSYVELPEAPFSMAGYRRPGLIEPQEDWRHFGCPSCGNVRTLPAGVDDAGPWCIHHGGEYAWRPPSGPESDWSQMVPVVVTLG